MQRHRLPTLTTLSGITVLSALVGCSAHHCSPYHQLFPVVPPMPHHHTYVPNEPLPYQASPFCYGYYPTCWRAWPADCPACPPPAACDAVIIEERPIESIEAIPTPPKPPAVQEPAASAPAVEPTPIEAPVEEPSAAPGEVESEAAVTIEPAPEADLELPLEKPVQEPATPPEPEQAKSQQAVPEVVIRPSGDSKASDPPMKAASWQDDLLAQQVVERLEAQKSQGTLKDFDIEVQVAHGVVTLAGTVTSTKQQQAALVATRKAPGVKKIVNSLTVTRK